MENMNASSNLNHTELNKKSLTSINIAKRAQILTSSKVITGWKPCFQNNNTIASKEGVHSNPFEILGEIDSFHCRVPLIQRWRTQRLDVYVCVVCFSNLLWKGFHTSPMLGADDSKRWGIQSNSTPTLPPITIVSRTRKKEMENRSQNY